jgi:hypothetical protein
MPLKNPFSRQPEQPMNEALLNAIVRLASENTPEAWRNFYTTLLNSTMLVAQEKGMNRPVLFDDGEGGAILAAFTDIERLMKVLPDIGGYGMMPFRDMCNVALGNGINTININPQIGPGGYVLRHQLEALANGQIPEIDAEDGMISREPIFRPAGDPSLPSQEVIEKLLAAATSLLEQEPSVEAGYIITTRGDEPDSESRLTIALRFNHTISTDARSAFIQKSVTKLESVAGLPLDVIWLEGERYKAIASVVPPFYERDLKH